MRREGGFCSGGTLARVEPFFVFAPASWPEGGRAGGLILWPSRLLLLKTLSPGPFQQCSPRRESHQKIYMAYYGCKRKISSGRLELMEGE